MDKFTFRDVGTRWVIYAPGMQHPYMSLDRLSTTDAGKTRVQEIVDALNYKHEDNERRYPSAANAATMLAFTLNVASPNDLRAALAAIDEIVMNMGHSARLRRIAGKLRTLLRYEVK